MRDLTGKKESNKKGTKLGNNYVKKAKLQEAKNKDNNNRQKMRSSSPRTRRTSSPATHQAYPPPIPLTLYRR
jgi:hypothetical protein